MTWGLSLYTTTSAFPTPGEEQPESARAAAAAERRAARRLIINFLSKDVNILCIN